MVGKICDIEFLKKFNTRHSGVKKFKTRQPEVKKNSRPGHIFPDPVIPISNERSLRAKIVEQKERKTHCL